MTKEQFIKQTAKNLNTSTETVSKALDMLSADKNNGAYISAGKLADYIGKIDNGTQNKQNNRKFWQI